MTRRNGQVQNKKQTVQVQQEKEKVKKLEVQIGKHRNKTNYPMWVWTIVSQQAGGSAALLALFLKEHELEPWHAQWSSTEAQQHIQPSLQPTVLRCCVIVAFHFELTENAQPWQQHFAQNAQHRVLKQCCKLGQDNGRVAQGSDQDVIGM